MEQNNTENNILSAETKGASYHAFSSRGIVIIVLISLLAGMAGGLYGALNLAKRPGIQKFFASPQSGGGTINQNLVLNEESAITKVVEETSAAVVSIVVSRDIVRSPGFGFFPNSGTGVQQVGAGSGFFISNEGLILTNKHVVADTQASYSVVTSDGKTYEEAEVLSRDPVNDLAILKVKASGVKYLSFADSSAIALGQHVVAIGNSLGQYQNTVTSGIVSGVGRQIIAGDRTTSEQLEGLIQTDAAINPGNSGGPLLNLAGQVVGINTAVDQQGQLVGFAIPSNDAKQAVESYQKQGRIIRPFIGIRYMMITESTAEQLQLPKKQGALLIRGNAVTDFAVLPGSPADRAGLQENDIIMEINGVTLTEDKNLTSALKAFQAGDTINLKVFSRGSEKNVTVTLGEAK